MHKVFISHATEDSRLALELRDWIGKTYPNRCTTFVSGSSESLPAGTKWLKKIEAELATTHILFCLLGPTTRDRPWIHFESGAAWLRGIKVVPVLHSGLSPNEISASLGQFQILRLADPNFPREFLNLISTACSFEGVPEIDFTTFAREVEAAARQVRGPREVVSLWNEALWEGKLDLARELLSKTVTEDFIKERYGSLKELSNNYKKASVYFQVHEAVHFDTHAAIVVYYVCSLKGDYFVTRYEDVVLLEGGKWNFAPQYVVRTQLRPSQSSSTRKQAQPVAQPGRAKKRRAG